jgi:hypothetical protein
MNEMAEVGNAQGKCRSMESEPIDLGDPSGQVVVNFPGDHFWLFQIAIGVLCSVYAFKEYVDDHIVAALVTVSLGVSMLLARAKFKTRPPEWALVDPASKILRLKQRWPKCSEIEIDISKLESVDAYVPRFQRFPVTLLNLHFEGMEKVSIVFDVESSETRFLAIPNEVVPLTVTELANMLSEVACKNNELKKSLNKSELQILYEKTIEEIRSASRQ